MFEQDYPTDIRCKCSQNKRGNGDKMKGFFECSHCGALTGEANPTTNGICAECLKKQKGDKMNYTKGEWKASNLIEPMGTFPRYYIESPHNPAVAMVDARNKNAGIDAHLIAAAPDMYEALKGICSLLSVNCSMAYLYKNDLSLPLSKGQRALSKAEGK